MPEGKGGKGRENTKAGVLRVQCVCSLNGRRGKRDDRDQLAADDGRVSCSL